MHSRRSILATGIPIDCGEFPSPHLRRKENAKLRGKCQDLRIRPSIQTGMRAFPLVRECVYAINHIESLT